MMHINQINHDLIYYTDKQISSVGQYFNSFGLHFVVRVSKQLLFAQFIEIKTGTIKIEVLKFSLFSISISMFPLTFEGCPKL